MPARSRRFPLLARMALLMALLAACSQDGPDSTCALSLQECENVSTCTVIDCSACEGDAPQPECRSASILEDPDPCGAGCVEPCSNLGEAACGASAGAGCKVATCPGCDGEETFAGCYFYQAKECPPRACP